MLSRLINKSRLGESSNKHARSDRFVKKQQFWFFQTREGFDVGPFEKRSDAQYALLYFVERSEWPSTEQLADFIKGCEFHNINSSHSSD